VGDGVFPESAVRCRHHKYTKGGQVIDNEGNPHTPNNEGTLCPKGSASTSLVTSPSRVTTVRYRRPYGTEWEDLDLDTAVDMIADRMLDARARGWQDTDDEGRVLRRTLGFSSLGGATLDNEENYLIKKLFSAGLGVLHVENQARI
jgi:formate dehydrogenase major subunit